MCDDAGNVYARQIDKTPVDPLELMLGSIQQITSDGKLAGTFQVTRALPGGAQSRTFSIHDGKACLWQDRLRRAEDSTVVEFATDGSTRTRAKIGMDDSWTFCTWQLISRVNTCWSALPERTCKLHIQRSSPQMDGW